MPTDTDLKKSIQIALSNFEGKPLAEASRGLLAALGYESNKTLVITPNTAQTFQAMFDPRKQMKAEAKLDEWHSVDLLFQVTGDELGETLSKQGQFFANQKVDNALIESYLFFAIALKGDKYSRTELANITREVNRCFKMPALVIFKHGKTLTFSIIARRISKREESKDVLEKVTLIKDIRFAENRPHVEILHDLALPQLAQKHKVSNFIELQRAWEKTLDTSELNKKFYKEIANWYFWAIENVEYPKGAGEEEEARNAISIIRLITRLIFVWFIKEKGLVPDVLFDAAKVKSLLNDFSPQESTYYLAILQNLFFATLNTEMGAARKFRGENKNEDGRRQNYMAHTLYRHRALFRDADAALSLFAGIPFLNGGLFECLDRSEKVNLKDVVIRVDGFSDEAKNQPRVPNFLFFGDEHDVDLNAIYDTKNKRYEVGGLIEIFRSYKFTIEENTPIEEEIALDPELLGKVFENLLAAYNPETGTAARKQTGSFYTPREIVNYMVDEALIAYLDFAMSLRDGALERSETSKQSPANNEEIAYPSGTMSQSTLAMTDRLRHLFAYNNQAPLFNEAETLKLIEAINNLKALDPACGSGAFPMGLLHKLVFVLKKLDPDNTRWREFQISKVADFPELVTQVEDAFKDNHDDYGRKLYLIQNCIYGVDIQPIAVQIAKLRFFISLVVEQKVDDSKPNRGIQPLPNLETKFVAANTLIGLQKPEAGKETAMSFGDLLYQGKRDELTEVRKRYFSARTPATKAKYREQDKKLRGELADLLKKDGWGSETAQQLAGWDPYNQNTHADFFDPEWMFGIEGGFDVVIGNPPYVRQEQITEFKPIFQKLYSCYTGTADLYVYFYERGIQALRENGVLAYISSNKYFRSGYGEKLRGYLSRQTTIRNLIDFGDAPVFTAIAYPSIIVTQKKIVAKNQVRALAWQLNDQLDEFDEILQTRTFALAQKELTPAGWRLETPVVLRLMEKLRRAGKPLSEYVNGRFYYGIKTGLNEAFVVDRATHDRLIAEHPSSAEILKPFLRGRDVKRWHLNYQDLWLLYVPWHFPLHLDSSVKGASQKAEKEFAKEYPAIYQHLLKFKKELTSRNKDETGIRYEWYALQRWGADYWQEFDKPKIVIPAIAQGAEYAPDYEGFFTNDKTSICVTDKVDYLLGILNSRLFWWFIQQTAASRQGGFYEFKPMYVSQIPIADTSNTKPIENLVTEILAAKRVNPAADTRALEAEIDRLVYGLYGLTEEEIEIVEG